MSDLCTVYSMATLSKSVELRCQKRRNEEVKELHDNRIANVVMREHLAALGKEGSYSAEDPANEEAKGANFSGFLISSWSNLLKMRRIS